MEPTDNSKVKTDVRDNSAEVEREFGIPRLKNYLGISERVPEEPFPAGLYKVRGEEIFHVAFPDGLQGRLGGEGPYHSLAAECAAKENMILFRDWDQTELDNRTYNPDFNKHVVGQGLQVKKEMTQAGVAVQLSEDELNALKANPDDVWERLGIDKPAQTVTLPSGPAETVNLPPPPPQIPVDAIPDPDDGDGPDDNSGDGIVSEGDSGTPDNSGEGNDTETNETNN